MTPHRAAIAIAPLFVVPLAAADITVSVGGGKNVRDLIGINTHDGIVRTDRPWSVPARVDALSSLKPSTFRYVGGEVASYMDLRNGDRVFRGGRTLGNGVVVDTDEIHEVWIEDMVKNHYGNRHPINQFRNAANTVGFKGMFLLNMITPGADFFGDPTPDPLTQTWWDHLDNRLSRNLDYLEAARNAGMDVRYIELGNEFFFYGGYRERTFPTTGWSYRNAANDWATQIKNDFPNSKLAVVGAFKGRSDRESRWNERIVDKVNWSKIDAVTLHVYLNGPYGSVGALGNEISARGEDSAMGKYLRRIHDQFDQSVIDSKTDRYIFNKGREIWYTEWNVDNLVEGIGDTWANTLATCYGASLLIDSPKPGRLQIQSYKELTRGPNESQLTAIGKAYSLLARAAKGATRVEKLRFSTNPGLRNSGGVPSYMGYRFSGGGKVRYFLANFSRTSVALQTQTSGFPVKGKRMARYKYSNNLTTTSNAPTYTGSTIGNRLWLDKHGVLLVE